jgi:hypothetical protein
MVTQLQHNEAIRRQQKDQADNAAQKAAFWALRAGGKEEAAIQMANPISTQTFNTKQGTYVVQGRSTENDVRAAAEKESLRIKQENERSTANAIANANIQKDRVFIVNSTNINPVTTKYLDEFTDRGSIVTPYYDPLIYNVQGGQQDNNTPIIDNPVVNFSGIGEFQITEVSKPVTSTSTTQNNKNNAATTNVNQTNLISNVNDKPVNTSELNKFATPDGVLPIPDTKPDYSNIAIIGAAGAILAGIVVVGSKR